MPLHDFLAAVTPVYVVREVSAQQDVQGRHRFPRNGEQRPWRVLLERSVRNQPFNLTTRYRDEASVLGKPIDDVRSSQRSPPGGRKPSDATSAPVMPVLSMDQRLGTGHRPELGETLHDRLGQGSITRVITKHLKPPELCEEIRPPARPEPATSSRLATRMEADRRRRSRKYVHVS